MGPGPSSLEITVFDAILNNHKYLSVVRALSHLGLFHDEATLSLGLDNFFAVCETYFEVFIVTIPKGYNKFRPGTVKRPKRENEPLTSL